jgi:CRISPR-associated endonuclease/helicase Cas3
LAKSLAEINEVPVQLELLKWICVTHDLGKVDPAFQQYIDGRGKGTPHALPSAWFTYASTKDVLAAEAVRRHHSHMVNVQEMISYWSGDAQSAEKIRQTMQGSSQIGKK